MSPFTCLKWIVWKHFYVPWTYSKMLRLSNLLLRLLLVVGKICGSAFHLLCMLHSITLFAYEFHSYAFGTIISIYISGTLIYWSNDEITENCKFSLWLLACRGQQILTTVHFGRGHCALECSMQMQCEFYNTEKFTHYRKCFKCLFIVIYIELLM